MRSPRKSTIKVIELAEEGVLTWEAIARECLSCMSESEVDDMATRCDWISTDDDDGNDDDSWEDSPHYDDDVQVDGESPRKPEV